MSKSEQQSDRLTSIQDTLKLIAKSKRTWKAIPKWAHQYEKDVRFLLKLIPPTDETNAKPKE